MLVYQRVYDVIFYIYMAKTGFVYRSFAIYLPKVVHRYHWILILMVWGPTTSGQSHLASSLHVLPEIIKPTSSWEEPL